MPTDATIDVLDNSDLDLTGVPLRAPVIDKRWVLSTIKDLYWEAKKTKAGTPAKQLTIVLVTAEQTESTNGQPVLPGLQTTATIWATPSGGLTQLMINQKVGRFQVAALGLAEPMVFGSPEQYIGRSVKAYYEAEADKSDPTIMYQRVNRWEKAS
jgi:hypothetical protein